MAKLTLIDISSGYLSLSTYNANNTLLEAALENTLSLDGTSPNTMSANLDLNSNKLVNITDGTNNQDAISLKQLNDASIVALTAAASAVTLADAGANYTATTVEAALAELASVATGEGASIIGVEDSGALLTATDVEGALAELAAGTTFAFPITPAETTASVTPVNKNFPELWVARYQTLTEFDGSTDNRTAILNAQKVAVAKGSGYIVARGLQIACASALPVLSCRAGVNGGHTGPLTGSLIFDFAGSQIDYTGSGSMLEFQGSGVDASDPKKIGVKGGNWVGTSSGEAFIKGNDMGRGFFHPESVSNMSAGRACLLRNNYGFTENFSMEGYDGGTLTILDNLIGLECQGITAAEIDEGGSLNGGSESFARLRTRNWQFGSIANAPVNNNAILIEASVYDSWIGSCGGNMINRDSGATAGTTKLIDVRGGMTRTVIENWKLEGASDATGDQAAIVHSHTESVTGTGISFTSPSTMSDTGNGFGGMRPGYKVTITGTSNNNLTLTVSTVTAGVVVFSESTVTTEAAGGSVTAAGKNSDQAHPRVIDSSWTGGYADVTNGFGKDVINGAHINHTAVAFDRSVSLTGLVTPAQITGSQNNYAPVDATDTDLNMGSANILILDSDGNYDITGLDDGFEGRQVVIHNAGNFTLTLVNSSGSSSAANRFSNAGDLLLPADATVEVIYYSSRWRVKNSFAIQNILYTFSNGDLTPSVALGSRFLSPAQTLTYTDLDDGAAGQEVTIISKGAITFDTTSSNLTGSSVDLVTAAGDVTRWICEDGTTWRLIAFVDASVDNTGGA